MAVPAEVALARERLEHQLRTTCQLGGKRRKSTPSVLNVRSLFARWLGRKKPWSNDTTSGLSLLLDQVPEREGASPCRPRTARCSRRRTCRGSCSMSASSSCLALGPVDRLLLVLDLPADVADAVGVEGDRLVRLGQRAPRAAPQVVRVVDGVAHRGSNGSNRPGTSRLRGQLRIAPHRGQDSAHEAVHRAGPEQGRDRPHERPGRPAGRPSSAAPPAAVPGQRGRRKARSGRRARRWSRARARRDR